MKTHLKLTIVLFAAIAALFFLVSKNHKFSSKPVKNITVLNNKTTVISRDARKVDSMAFKRLIPFFKLKKDEFDASGTVTYLPKGSPEKPKSNAFYCYFEHINDSVGNLRVRMQVENKEWLFYKKCQFLIDGVVYDYTPSDIEFSEGGAGAICEWFDNAVNQDNYSIIKALSVAKAAKVKVYGRHYDKIFILSNDQLLSIDHTLNLYTALNGDLAFK
ncbi:MAG: hypothetical protein DI539_11580 [Flavobacterium psychrophilum]|nr:MAG: hypothetical protein DI539_11580 [Flavobacterium psychrophilum]